MSNGDDISGVFDAELQFSGGPAAETSFAQQLATLLQQAAFGGAAGSVRTGAAGGSQPPKDPFFFSSTDLPGLVITPVVLKDNNYAEWSKSFRLSLVARHKVGFLNGTVVKPEGDLARLEDWHVVQAVLVQWVLNTIDPKLRGEIPYCDEVGPLWSLLEERYAVSNGTRQNSFLRELSACNQSAKMSISSYFGALQRLWEEQAVLFPLPICECGRPPTQLQSLRDTKHYHQLLGGFSSEYSATRSALLAQKPPPTLNSAYQTLREAEDARNADQKVVSHELFALSSRPSNVVDQSKLVCSHCKKPGHDVAGCFDKHGFPEWFLERQRKGRGGDPRH